MHEIRRIVLAAAAFMLLQRSTYGIGVLGMLIVRRIDANTCASRARLHDVHAVAPTSNLEGRYRRPTHGAAC
jgi:hypothetical protein